MDCSDSSTTVSSHLRYGDVFTTGRTATVWNVTDMDSNLAYLVQMVTPLPILPEPLRAHLLS